MSLSLPRSPDAFTVGPNTVRLLRDGTVAHAAMLAAIAEAREEIVLEIYWIGGAAGERFRDALASRARAGVDVRVIYDSVGSFGLPNDFWTPLVEAGGRVREFSPIAPWRRRFRLTHVHLRDHRKNLVVDRTLGFAGGINLADLWAPAEGLGWRDDAIEIRGEAPLLIREAFYRVWATLGGTLPTDTEAMGLTDPRVSVLTNVVAARPNRAIRRTYLMGIRRATTSIMIASAYFLPGPLFLHALRSAARRGVRVRVLVPERADVLIVTLAASSIVGRLLEDGIEVFAYSGRILHAKTAVFDERFAMIGSHNLDALSWRFNLECNVFVDHAPFATHVARSFDADCAEARAVTLAEWRARPWSLRLAAWFVAMFREVL